MERAKAAYERARAAGVDFSVGPCLGIIEPGWVADVAHDPRQPVDDEAANRCGAYRNGDADHVRRARSRWRTDPLGLKPFTSPVREGLAVRPQRRRLLTAGPALDERTLLGKLRRRTTAGNVRAPTVDEREHVAVDDRPVRDPAADRHSHPADAILVVQVDEEPVPGARAIDRLDDLPHALWAPAPHPSVAEAVHAELGPAGGARTARVRRPPSGRGRSHSLRR